MWQRSHTIKKPYDKQFKTIPEQIALLQARGLVVPDVASATLCLQRLGYYRVTGYLYPFRKRESRKTTSGGTEVAILDQFQDTTELSQVIDLYTFDKRLRMMFLDAIERVEVALRVDVALMLGARDKAAHRESAHLHGNFSRKNHGRDKSSFEEWIARLDERESESREEFSKHFRANYHPPVPIWVSIETWNFGLLSRLIEGMKHDDQLALCARYGLPRPSMLVSWIKAISTARNICAHHSRLWNRSLVDQPGPPAFKEMAGLHDHWALNPLGNKKIYCIAATLQHFTKVINPHSNWASRIKELAVTFPKLNTDKISLYNAGFTNKWESEKLWN